MLGKYLVAAEVYGEYRTDAVSCGSRGAQIPRFEEWITKKLIGAEFKPIVRKD